MNPLSLPARLALCLAFLTISVLLLARFLGMIPDDRPAVVRGRTKLCESMAIHFSLGAERDDSAHMQSALESVAQRNPEILSLAVRRADHQIVAEWGEHPRSRREFDGHSPETHIGVPIGDPSAPWGYVEARFAPWDGLGRWSWRTEQFLLLVTFVVGFCAFAYYIYLDRVLKHLKPNSVIPTRVKMALDTMAEGLLILDGSGRIMLANAAFARTIGNNSEDLVGRFVEDLAWRKHRQEESLPWKITLEEGHARLGGMVQFLHASQKRLTFLVNSTPIHGPEGENGGALVSFDDITNMEKKKTEMHKMLESLRKSRDEIRRQNRELEQLATRDSLTGCYNRRSFLERFNSLWKSARRHDHPLTCIILDVDHFKLINDTHGHLVGDEVLQRIGQILVQTARESDTVCRYGGEEFAVLLPYTNIDDAADVAERFRAALEHMPFPNLSITASLGVSSMAFGANDPHELLDQADRCLYFAKRNGRNQVVRWDQLPEDVERDKAEAFPAPSFDDHGQTPIPFQAVAALISALAYRDAATAEHSRRVADLCVATAEEFMSLSECYVLENAALLHDIGKIGVPDSILLKPAGLTEEEWQVMRRQERIGVEIIRASFDSKELVEIVASDQAWYGGTPHAPHLPTGEAIPLGARILSIANAYDAMTSNQVYRESKTMEEAFAELRRCAGTQFDPVLVERFIAMVQVRQNFSLPAVSRVSRETALQFGLQIEQLMAALDDRDIEGLQALGGRLQAMARKHQVMEIAEKASQLTHSAQNAQAAEVLNAANELIELCRSTQTSYVRVSGEGKGEGY